jgi:alpha-D-ribose 1-methylphosphonate 5-triphosphate synthase subunit PhnL
MPIGETLVELKASVRAGRFVLIHGPRDAGHVELMHRLYGAEERGHAILTLDHVAAAAMVLETLPFGSQPHRKSG